MFDTRDPVSPFTCSALSRRHETMEKLQEWMTEKVYGLNGTKDKTLKIRGNPKVFIEITPPTSRTATPPATSLLPYCLTT